MSGVNNKRWLKYAAYIVLIAITFTFFTACSVSCSAQPPKITGKADEGLYVYDGFSRTKSDFKNPTGLFETFNDGDTAINDFDVTSIKYLNGDEVVLCAIVYGNSADNIPNTGYLMSFDLKTKEKMIIYKGYSDGLIPVSIHYVTDTLFVLTAGKYTDSKGFVVDRNGTVIYDDFIYTNSAKKGYLTPEYIFTYNDAGSIKAKRWLDADFIDLINITDEKVNGLHLEGDVLMITTYTQNEEKYKLSSYGTTVYNMKTKESMCLVDSSKGEAILGSVNFHNVVGGYYGKYSQKLVVYSSDEIEGAQYHNSEIWYFDSDEFTNTLVYKFEDTEKGYTLRQTGLLDGRYLQLSCTWIESDGYRYKEYYYDVQDGVLKTGHYTPKGNDDYIAGTLAENDDYCLYQTTEYVVLGPTYYILNRYNKETKKSDVMCYKEGKPYNIDAMRYY